MSIRNLINELIKTNRDLDGQLQLINGLLQEVEKVKNELRTNFQGSDTMGKLLSSLENTRNILKNTDAEIRKSQEKLRNLQAKLRG
jgi:uncharacterized protein YhaN